MKFSLFSNSKKDRNLLVIFLTITIFGYTMFILNVTLYQNNRVFNTIFNYIVNPIFWVGMTYVSFSIYYRSVGSKVVAKTFIFTVMVYMGVVVILSSVPIYFLISDKMVMLNLSSWLSGYDYAVRLLILLGISYLLSILVVFVSSAITESIIYAELSRRLSGNFIIKQGSHITLVSYNDKTINGLAFGGVVKGFILIRTTNESLGHVEGCILAHEVQHVRGKHVPIVLSSIFTIPIYVILLLNLNMPDYLIILPGIFIAILPLMLFRFFEVNADRTMYKVYGGKSLDCLLSVLKLNYNVDSTEKAPLLTRITHPGKRSIVLANGDAVAPHAIWEFPFVTSLFTALVYTLAFYTYFSQSHSSFLNNIYVGSYFPYFLMIVYAMSLLSSFIITILVGLVIKPIARFFLGGKLTSKGLLNLSILTSGLYLAVMSLWFMGVNQYLLLMVFFVAALLISSYYVGFSRYILFFVLSFLALMLIISKVLGFVFIYELTHGFLHGVPYEGF